MIFFYKKGFLTVKENKNAAEPLRVIPAADEKAAEKKAREFLCSYTKDLASKLDINLLVKENDIETFFGYLIDVLEPNFLFFVSCQEVVSFYEKHLTSTKQYRYSESYSIIQQIKNIINFFEAKQSLLQKREIKSRQTSLFS
ncbi:MAG TPA: hypothetical protein PK495_07795 [Bacteroidales bacterium]|nr:hypothetical protein [Bacteroidales bacterium]HQB20464.1 hypothetical protein [Bacteroidales bacterium]